jgi:hypothetical protein
MASMLATVFLVQHEDAPFKLQTTLEVELEPARHRGQAGKRGLGMALLAMSCSAKVNPMMAAACVGPKIIVS